MGQNLIENLCYIQENRSKQFILKFRDETSDKSRNQTNQRRIAYEHHIRSGGQIGSQVAMLLEGKGLPVRRVFHRISKQVTSNANSSTSVVADYFDKVSLEKAFRGGDTVLLLTPESMASDDMLADAKKVFANCKDALNGSGIRRVIGLSSGGAQLTKGTGTLQLYAMLEETLQSLDMEVYIVRPAYYYSNWMMYMDVVQNNGILPTFFPPALAIPMIAPKDVATFIADVMENGAQHSIREITGPDLYSAGAIARFMGEALGRDVMAVQIPQCDWLPGLLQAGFSKSSAEYLLGMTQAVINEKTSFTMPPVYTGTTFSAYLTECLPKG